MNKNKKEKDVEELKEDLEEKQKSDNSKNLKNKSFRYNGRISKADDVMKYAIFKSMIEKQNKKLNSVITPMVMEGIDKYLNEDHDKKVKNELFYAFQKSSFASQKMIVNKINELKFLTISEMAILSAKLDVIINILFGNAKVDKDLFANLAGEFLKESDYFKFKRVSEREQIKKFLNKAIQKTEKEEKTNNEYIENYVNSDLEEILKID